MGYFAELFKERTITTCDTCSALRKTISILEEEVEFLRGELRDERERSTPRPVVAVNQHPDFHGAVRKARVPWNRVQAKLESESARQAAHQDKEVWLERVRKAEQSEKSDG